LSIVYKEIQTLPRECRKVINLYIEGLTIAQIAIQLGKEERNVQNQKTIGINKLKKRFGPIERFFRIMIIMYIVMN
jgi:DNA-directed RNA polymerase specialized sigma24 family protein